MLKVKLNSKSSIEFDPRSTFSREAGERAGMEAKLTMLEETNLKQRVLLDEKERIIDEQKKVIEHLTREMSALKNSL